MRFAGLAHNTGLYVPELYPDLELAAVPGRSSRDRGRARRPAAPGGRSDDRAGGGHVGRGRPRLGRRAVRRRSLPRGPGARLGAAGVLRGRADDRRRPRHEPQRPRLALGRRRAPAIRLVYSWRRGDRVASTTRPVHGAAGRHPARRVEIVPVHVVPPLEPGRYELELDLVHEGVRRFGVTLLLEPEVRPGGASP